MIENIELMTEQLTKEFGFVCKSYINNYACFSNDHDELAERIIVLLDKFKEYSKKPDKKDKDNKVLLDFFTLIVLINDINLYLKGKESVKFKDKLERLMTSFNLPFLIENPEQYGQFTWANQNSSHSKGVVWTNKNCNFVGDSLFICMAQDINHTIISLNLSTTGNTLKSYYSTLLTNWLNSSPIKNATPEKPCDFKESTLKEQFVAEHFKLLTEAKDSFGGCFRGTKVDYSQSLAHFFKHAQDNDNRSRQVFINLGLMDKEGILTQKCQDLDLEEGKKLDNVI